MQTEILNLLEQVSGIVKNYDDLAAKTGENFNIFSVLKLDSDEVRLHSRLLGELLNPRGSHGQNEVFLKLFISTIGLENHYQNDDLLKEAIVLVEENIGNITDDYLKGGRIDIVVKFPNQLKEIVIENKIYANDQKNQLGRYFEKYPKANIIYLTLFERIPENYSLGDKLTLSGVNCITYKKHIKEWLEQCLPKINGHPLIKETITQYLYLIKKLTNQTTNHEMKNELVKIIVANKEYVKTAKEIADVWHECKMEIVKRIEENLKNIAMELNIEYSIDLEYEKDKEGWKRIGEEETGFWFYSKKWCYCIYFYFETTLESIIVGVDSRGPEARCSKEIIDKLQSHFKDFDTFNKIDNPDWIWVSNFRFWQETKWEDKNSKIPNAIKEKTKMILEKLLEFKS